MSEKISVLIPEEEVDRKIEELGRKISEDYEGKAVHLICVLKGSIFFTCELAKRITVPVTLDFMSCSSYGSDTKSSGVEDRQGPRRAAGGKTCYCNRGYH